MKINKIKVNFYGKLKDKEIDLKDNVNIIHGKNEAGKSTILSFITSMLYGISRNKNGKYISDFEKYKPWNSEDYSGKLEYELDNKENYEVYRDFKKRKPQIFNGLKEDITQNFNTDKTKGAEFFYEQTQVDEQLFLSTVVVNQNSVKIEKNDQNILIQKIANLLGTGEDNVSYARAMERINRKQLAEVGTERSREKPLNILLRENESLTNEKNELEKYKDLKYEIEENKDILTEEYENLKNEFDYLQEIKSIKEDVEIKEEKISVKEKILSDNKNKIEKNKEEIQKFDDEFDEEKSNRKLIKLNKQKTKRKNISILAFVILLIANIAQFFILKENIIKYFVLLTIPLYILVMFIFMKNKNKEIKEEERSVEKQKTKLEGEKNNYIAENNVLEKNNNELAKEISEIRNNVKEQSEDNFRRVNIKYLSKLDGIDYTEKNEIYEINSRCNQIQNQINENRIKIHKLNVDKNEVEPKLDSLANLEEKIATNDEKIYELQKLDKSMNLAKEVLTSAYEDMKNNVTPKFTEYLSKIVDKITDGKYKNVTINDEKGIIVELEDGNYIEGSRLSVGTIDQLYLSLRLAMVDNLSDEKLPIILDEAFAYYDTERLANILRYLTTEYKDRQIIIFTCTEREKQVLSNLNIDFNFIDM